MTAELLKHGHSVTTVKFQDTNLPALPTSGHPNFTLVGAVIVIVMFKGLPRSTSASTKGLYDAMHHWDELSPECEVCRHRRGHAAAILHNVVHLTV